MAGESQSVLASAELMTDIQSFAVPADIIVDEKPRLSQSRDYVLLAGIATLVSLCALIFYYRQNSILLYGDAVAHINIARRVFDSRTPGFFQLGTVWLPLPHVLDMPFVVNDRLWRTGIGASIPSMLAYIAGALGVFRLVRSVASRSAAWAAALIYAFNPNLIYMQSTAMTEPLYLALMIWALVYFVDFVQLAKRDAKRARVALQKCAFAVGADMLVRYDGWFLAAVLGLAALGMLVVNRTSINRVGIRTVRRAVIEFALLTVSVGGLWLAYNQANYGNPLEWANGPYSARAIQERSRTTTFPSYPGENSSRTAALYFLKVSRLNVADGRSEKVLFALAFAALLATLFFVRRAWPLGLLWTPAMFYVACIAWGSVPVYVPQWYPFGYYNVRYGLQLLPATAVFAALLAEYIGALLPRRAGLVAVMLIAAWGYVAIWQGTPICLREAHVNGAVRLAFDHELGEELARLPQSSRLMMDCGAHSGAVQAAGIPFRRVLRESNPPLWEVALSHPAESADYIIAFPNDDVYRAVRLFP
ncbi:MAG TPA: glycosyltransferase family 39 protein, partial [Candidatus Angelobacter sp.]|nr:glycosyltransferase family 39 protein [Candidatus Angelobacter sp.]